MIIAQTFLLLVCALALGFANFQIYYAFYLPEKARRDAFDLLTDEQIEKVKNEITAEHFFKLSPNIIMPTGTKKKR